MKRHLMLMALTLTIGLGMAACAHNAAPTVSPTISQAQHAIAVLDVLRDAAVSMNAQTPKLLSDSATAKVVSIHESLVQVIAAAPAGWQASVQAALDELPKGLAPADYAKIQPYVVVAEAALSVAAS